MSAPINTFAGPRKRIALEHTNPLEGFNHVQTESSDIGVYDPIRNFAAAPFNQTQ